MITSLIHNDNKTHNLSQWLLLAADSIREPFATWHVSFPPVPESVFSFAKFKLIISMWFGHLIETPESREFLSADGGKRRKIIRDIETRNAVLCTDPPRPWCAWRESLERSKLLTKCGFWSSLDKREAAVWNAHPFLGVNSVTSKKLSLIADRSLV